MLRFFRSKIGIFIMTLAVIILLIFLHHLKILRPVENLIFICTESIERVFYRGINEVSDFFNLLTAIRDLNQENQTLIQENRKLLLENIKLKETAEENRFLRAQLNLQEEQGISGVGAQVIGLNPDSLIQSILVDQGESSGVEVGAPVVYDQGFLVGRVIESYHKVAKVLLITDRNSVINALVSESRASGNVSGQHGIGLILDMIPQTDVVNIGDTVITSGIDGDIPAGLAIGEVIKVESSANQLFQRAQVKPYVNFVKMERVLILKDYKKGEE